MTSAPLASLPPRYLVLRLLTYILTYLHRESSRVFSIIIPIFYWISLGYLDGDYRDMLNVEE